MDDVVIRAEGLGKKYIIGHEAARERNSMLRDAIARTARNVLRTTSDMLRGRALVGGDATEEFWALKDINFEIKRGEVVGVIGRNGAGKSTLLKILSRITEPTTGRVEIRGRVASLLEVGTGFHPELTGRENIYLNGAILGMTRAEIRRKFDEIVAFAEIERFLDTPVKRYSSGMYVRLAFAVAAHLEPEILVVDEVLAVGDAAFQQKCLGKMSDFSGGGCTVLLVSHNLGVIREICTRAILLSEGRVSQDGPSSKTVSTYLETSTESSKLNWRRTKDCAGRASITALTLRSEQDLEMTELVMGDTAIIGLEADFHLPIAHPQFGIIVHAVDGTAILDLRTRHAGPDIPLALGPLSLSMRLGELNLYPGDYYLSAFITDASSIDLDNVEFCVRFTVLPVLGPFGDMRLSLTWGKYYVPSEWKLSSGGVEARKASKGMRAAGD